MTGATTFVYRRPSWEGRDEARKRGDPLGQGQESQEDFCGGDSTNAMSWSSRTSQVDKWWTEEHCVPSRTSQADEWWMEEHCAPSRTSQADERWTEEHCAPSPGTERRPLRCLGTRVLGVDKTEAGIGRQTSVGGALNAVPSCMSFLGRSGGGFNAEMPSW